MNRDDPDLSPFGGPEARCAPARAQVAIVPVPYEGTVSYGTGTALGPAAILKASTQVELYDEELGFEPWRAGLHTEPAVEIAAGEPPEDVARRVGKRVGELMDAGKWVVVLGGEHSITPGAVTAVASRHRGLHVVQLDAHADLRDEYEGSAWSHACAMARCLDVAPVRAVGIRSYSVQEAERVRRGIPGYRMIHAREMQGDGWHERALGGLDGAPVYLTVDVDFFDPAVIPSTGTPEPGGGCWRPTLGLLAELFRRACVVACDVVELAPLPGLSHPDFTVARLVYKLIGWRFRDRLVDPSG